MWVAICAAKEVANCFDRENLGAGDMKLSPNRTLQKAGDVRSRRQEGLPGRQRRVF